LEAQFLYTLALARRDGDFDAAKVSALFQEATERFPNSPELQIERARFHRRIWNYGEAIAGFTAIAERTRDAADRREAAVDLIESLVTAAIYTEDVALPGGMRLNRQELVERAHEWLARLFDFPDVARDVAMLRDQVELELGGEINWGKNDAAYDSVIGGSERYVSTIVGNLDSLRSGGGEFTTNLWEAVVQNFTHPDVLRGLGRLYLRSAELGRRNEALKDAERAYGCFNACRILEVSEYGRESSVTCYERAHAILAGAVIAQSLNPFNADHEVSLTLLDLAEARFSSARDRSVGSFHQAAGERLKELRLLRRSLKSTAK
jgi:tetratricopeptide (TPR) repeat protein